MKSSIEYDKGEIPFEILYADRKTMEIAVHPDGRITVTAPIGTKRKPIHARVTKRARWIKKKLEYFCQFEPRTPPRRYVGGETHLFLGRQYRLKLVRSPANEVRLRGAYFYVLAPDSHDTAKIKLLLDEWYAHHAKLLFQKRLTACYQSAMRLNVPFPEIRVRKLTKRWGSCSRSGKVVLNTALIKAPLFCIDYVIMHELCHLKIPHHNEKYYRLLGKHMPNWKKRKERLESAGLV